MVFSYGSTNRLIPNLYCKPIIHDAFLSRPLHYTVCSASDILMQEASLSVQREALCGWVQLRAEDRALICVGKMELSDQDSGLALIVPTVYIIRVCLHVYGIFTGDRAVDQSWEYLSRGGAERKRPFSPLPVFLVGN